MNECVCAIVGVGIPGGMYVNVVTCRMHFFRGYAAMAVTENFEKYCIFISGNATVMHVSKSPKKEEISYQKHFVFCV